MDDGEERRGVASHGKRKQARDTRPRKPQFVLHREADGRHVAAPLSRVLTASSPAPNVHHSNARKPVSDNSSADGSVMDDVVGNKNLGDVGGKMLRSAETGEQEQEADTVFGPREKGKEKRSDRHESPSPPRPGKLPRIDRRKAGGLHFLSHS